MGARLLDGDGFDLLEGGQALQDLFDAVLKIWGSATVLILKRAEAAPSASASDA